MPNSRGEEPVLPGERWTWGNLASCCRQLAAWVGLQRRRADVSPRGPSCIAPSDRYVQSSVSYEHHNVRWDSRAWKSLWEQFSGTMIHVSWLGASIRAMAIAGLGGLGKNHPANEKNNFH